MSDHIDDNEDLLAGLPERPPAYVEDGIDGHGHTRFVLAEDLLAPEAGPIPDHILPQLPDPREDNGPQTLHDATLEEIRRQQERRAAG